MYRRTFLSTFENFSRLTFSLTRTQAQGRRTQLTETGGIDILGNVIESSILSVNQNAYGDLHNMGHMLLAYIHDPDNRFLVSKPVNHFYRPGQWAVVVDLTQPCIQPINLRSA